MNIDNYKIVKRTIIKSFITANKDNWNKFKLTDEGFYSVSLIKTSKLIIDIINSTFNSYKNIILTDCTANNGADSINLSLSLKKINSIELNKENYIALLNNIKVSNVNNILTYNNDSTKIIKKLKQDVIYVDAPWGGREYKSKKNINLFLSNIELYDFYKINKKYAKLFIFKVPYNYNINNFISNRDYSRFNYYKVKKDTRVLYYLITIQP